MAVLQLGKVVEGEENDYPWGNWVAGRRRGYQEAAIKKAAKLEAKAAEEPAKKKANEEEHIKQAAEEPAIKKVTKKGIKAAKAEAKKKEAKKDAKAKSDKEQAIKKASKGKM
ncbi:hypothetical protein Tco_1233334 [Tanacetum coccineum]